MVSAASARLVLLTTCVAGAATVWYVHQSQEWQKAEMRKGPLRDQARKREREEVLRREREKEQEQEQQQQQQQGR